MSANPTWLASPAQPCPAVHHRDAIWVATIRSLKSDQDAEPSGLSRVRNLSGASPLTATTGLGPAVTRASLQADLLAAGERATRLTSRIRQLETRLSEALGEQAWREPGLGAPTDIDALNQKINHLEQQSVELGLQLTERDQDLTAARAANRELMAQLNTAEQHR